MVFTKWFIIVLAALFLTLLIYTWGYADGYDDGINGRW